MDISRSWPTTVGQRQAGRYDPAGNPIDWLPGAGQSGTHMMMVSPGLSGDDYVAEIVLKPLELSARIKTGSGPDGMAWLP